MSQVQRRVPAARRVLWTLALLTSFAIPTHANKARAVPEIDGTTYINDGSARAGDLVEVEITEAFDYDLVGHITRVLHPAPPRPDHPRLEAPVAAAPMTAGRRALRVIP